MNYMINISLFITTLFLVSCSPSQGITLGNDESKESPNIVTASANQNTNPEETVNNSEISFPVQIPQFPKSIVINSIFKDELINSWHSETGFYLTKAEFYCVSAHSLEIQDFYNLELMEDGWEIASEWNFTDHDENGTTSSWKNKDYYLNIFYSNQKEYLQGMDEKYDLSCRRADEGILFLHLIDTAKIVLPDYARKILFTPIQGGNYFTTPFVLSPDGKYLATGFLTPQVFLIDQLEFIWQLPDWAPIDAPEKNFISAFSPDSKYLVTSRIVEGITTDHIAFWDINTQNVIDILEDRSGETPKGALGWSNEEDYFITYSLHAIWFWDYGNREEILNINLFRLTEPDFPGYIFDIDFTKGGDTLIVATDIGVWKIDVDNFPDYEIIGERIPWKTDDFSRARIDYGEVSPDGKMILTYSTSSDLPVNEKPIITLWDASLGTRLNAENIMAGYYGTWSPDGSMIAGVSSDDPRNLIVWDASNGKIIHSFEGHRDEIRNISWFQNEDSLASSSSDELIIWDTSWIGK